MTHTLTLRLPEADAIAVRRIAEREKRSVNEVGARMIEEWLRQDNYPLIEFRSFSGERLPCLKNGIRLWKLIMTAQGYGMDVKKTAVHYNDIYSAAQIQAALDYYNAYPQEIDRPIQENQAVTFETLRRKLPHIEQFNVNANDLDAASGQAT